MIILVRKLKFSMIPQSEEGNQLSAIYVYLYFYLVGPNIEMEYLQFFRIAWDVPPMHQTIDVICVIATKRVGEKTGELFVHHLRCLRVVMQTVTSEPNALRSAAKIRHTFQTSMFDEGAYSIH